MLHNFTKNIMLFSITKMSNVFNKKANYILIMKRNLIILGLFLLCFEAFAVEKIYLQQPSTFNNRIYQRPVYNPYGTTYYNPYGSYYNSYRYKRPYYNNAKRIQQINRWRNLNRFKNNILSWNFNRNNNGTLTGYSTPINQNVYQQMGYSNWDDLNKKMAPNCTTDIFSTPTSNGAYYSNGEYIDKTGGLSNRTGVKIIYD